MAKRVSMAVLVVMMVVAATIHCSAAQRVHVVGDMVGWGIPDGGFATYTTWAAMQNFTVGDTLVFNFTTRNHDVAEVTREAFLLCNTTIPTISLTNIGPANITLDTAGEHYYLCTFAGHCDAGQRLAINVTKASSPSPAPAPAPATTPAPKSAPTPAPSRSPVNYTVGDDMGWIVPPGGIIAYQTWAFNKTFMVGDTLVFNFNETIDDVAEVTKTGYAICDSNTTISTFNNSPASIILTTAGEHFYICTSPNNCLLGQRLAINVTGSSTATPPSTSATPPSTPPSTSATPPSISTPPSTSATPPSSTPSPPGTTATPPTPGSNAPSFTAAAGFSATFLSIAVAYLLY